LFCFIFTPCVFAYVKILDGESLPAFPSIVTVPGPGADFPVLKVFFLPLFPFPRLRSPSLFPLSQTICRVCPRACRRDPNVSFSLQFFQRLLVNIFYRVEALLSYQILNLYWLPHQAILLSAHTCFLRFPSAEVSPLPFFSSAYSFSRIVEAPSPPLSEIFEPVMNFAFR